MPRTFALVLLAATGVYLAAGALFAIAFVRRGAGRLDVNARDGSLAFRLAIVPGSVLLWPLLARLWWRAR